MNEKVILDSPSRCKYARLGYCKINGKSCEEDYFACDLRLLKEEKEQIRSVLNG